jgi:putative ABC transport system permease protein
MWKWAALERLSQDLRFAARMLRRSPGFAAVAVCTLALGIGATTAIFTVVNAIVLRPLPFPDPARLVMVWETLPDSTRPNVVQTQNFLDWHARARAFDGIAAFDQLPATVLGTGDAEQLLLLRVSGDFFATLGVPPALGRWIRQADDVRGAPRTVVLTHRLWRTRFGADPAVIGQTITIAGNSCEVIGVMPPDFVFPGTRAELFVPLQINPATAPFEGRNLSAVARLRPGVTIAAAQAEMSAIVLQIGRERPDNHKWGALVMPLHEHAAGDVRLALLVLFGAVACVLLIACVNIANLLSMRSTARAREISVRLALGASRGDVVRQLLTESLLLAALGGACGLALAYAGVPAIVALFPASAPLPRAQEIAVDRWVLAFTLGVSIAAGLLFGLAPAWHARRGNLAGALQGSGRSVTGGGARLRSGLVIAEVALAVMLVIGAGLMVRSLVRLTRVDPGFTAERVLTVRMLLSVATYGDVPRRAAFVDEVLARVRALPQVTAASSVHILPLLMQSGTGYHRVDRPAPEPGAFVGGAVSVVSPGYFRTMGVPLKSGRDFTGSDRLDTPRVVIINETMARRLFPGENPLGKRLDVSWSSILRTGKAPEWEIVGVAADVRQEGLRADVGSHIYISHDQEPNLRASLVVRTAGDPLAVAASVRQAIRGLDPQQGVSDVEAMQTVMSESVAQPRLQTLLLGAFGALALIMACVGLYGVLAYSVEQRRREMGVRLALGAAPRGILRLVVGEGLRLTAAGVLGGLAAAFALTRYLATLLYDVQPHDTTVFAAVPLLLLCVAGLACWLPALRATRVDPASILRDQ